MREKKLCLERRWSWGSRASRCLGSNLKMGRCAYIPREKYEEEGVCRQGRE